MTGTKEYVCLVTGGAGGIGAATCLLLATELPNSAVVVADVNEAQGQQVVQQIIRQGGTASFFKLDVTKEQDWIKAVAFCVQQYGCLTTLINNAGISGSLGSIETVSLEDYEKTVAVIGTRVFLGCKICAEELFKAGSRGSVVTIASIHSFVGNGRAPGYSASKGAVTSLTRGVAVSWASKGVRCNCVHPGFIDTPLLSALPTEAYDALASKHPIGRLGKAEEVAQSVLFLADPRRSSFITGSSLMCDGGYTAV